MSPGNCLTIEQAYQIEDCSMMAAAQREIERVPPALPTLLVEAGKLSRPPCFTDTTALGYRPATPKDASDLVWLIAWEGTKTDGIGLRHASGALAFYDHFDWHTSSDVREIVFITGSARAVHDLIQHIRSSNRRLIGYVEDMTPNLATLVTKLCGKQTRRLVEEVCQD